VIDGIFAKPMPLPICLQIRQFFALRVPAKPAGRQALPAVRAGFAGKMPQAGEGGAGPRATIVAC
jgi:hypothetical protein